MKSQLTKATNEQPMDTVSGDSVGDNGNKQRAVIGEIDTIKKIVEVLETVIGDIVPTIIDRQNAQEQNQKNRGTTGTESASVTASDPIKIIPKGLKLLQHHTITASNVDDTNTGNDKP